MVLTSHPLLEGSVGLVLLGELDPIVGRQHLLDASERLLERSEIGERIVLRAHKIGVVEDLVFRIEVFLRTGRHGGLIFFFSKTFFL